MNKILKIVLVLSLLVFSALAISGCSSEKEKIAKEYTGVWRSDKSDSASDTQYYLVLKPNKTNDNALDVVIRGFRKSNPDFYGPKSKMNFEPRMTQDDATNAIIDEKSKIVKIPELFNASLIITTEGDQKFIKLNGHKFIKKSNEPSTPELKDIKF